MDSYYSHLAITKLNEAEKAMAEARQYAADAKAPEWMIKSMSKITNGIRNRIDEILQLREPKTS